MILNISNPKTAIIQSYNRPDDDKFEIEEVFYNESDYNS